MNLMKKKEIILALKEKLPGWNSMKLPRVVSVSVNAGVGRLAGDKGALEKVVGDISQICGQKAVITKSKKSVSAFKIRENYPVGVAVTLRGDKMNDFLLKVINITLPRLREFNGISRKSLDGKGNLSIGFREHIFFPEIKFEDVDKAFGLQVNIKTSAPDNQSAIALFEALGLPFKKEEKNG